MKKTNRCLGASLAAAVTAAVAALLPGGCESDSPHELTVNVSPDHAKLKSGESVALTASGWSTYEWSLSNGDIGHLSSSRGERVVYLATKGIPGGGVVHIPGDKERTTTTETVSGVVVTKVVEISYVDHDTYYEKITRTWYEAGASGVIPAGLPTADRPNVSREVVEVGEIDYLKQTVTVTATTAGTSGTNSSAIGRGKATILQY
jgi:hypothetical protein